MSSVTCPAVLPRISSVSRCSIGPVSRPSSICMMVMPVSASPARMARWMGAAPRQRGSSEAWMLMQPRGKASSTARGRIKPYAATISTSAAAARSSSTVSAALSDGHFSTRAPSLSAASETALGVSFRPRPAGRSGCVRTSGMSWPAAAIASRARAANGGVPANATRIDGAPALRRPCVGVS